MARHFGGLTLLALAALGGWHAAATAAPDGAPAVNGIQINGARHLDVAGTKGGMATTEPQPWELVWALRQPHPFDLNVWHTDLARIQRDCRAAGYYQCRVINQEVIRDGERGVRLIAQLEEGEPTLVSSLHTEGLENVPDDVRDAVLKDLPLCPGRVFRQDDLGKARLQLQAALSDQGYSEPHVEGQAVVGADTRRADPTLIVKAGQRQRFGQVTLRGKPPPNVPAHLILEQVQAAIHPGAWFSARAVEEARLRLFRMGVFANAKVILVKRGDAAATIPVEVEVEESLLHSQSVSAGVNVDPAQTEGHVSAEYTDLDFMGDLRSLSLSADVGYALIPGVVAALTSPGSARSGWTLDAEAKLEQPGAFSPDVTTQFDLGVRRDFQPAFDYLEGRAKLGAVWQPRAGLYVFPSYNLELYGLNGSISHVISDDAHVLGCAPTAARPFGGWSTCDVMLSYAEVVVELDGRDDRAQPRNGFFAALSVQGSGGPLGGDYSYLRIQPEARFYRTFESVPDLTLSAKLKLGTLMTLGSTTESPVMARFYSGGANSMRGCGAQRCSPMLLVPADPTGAGPQTIPIGGDGQLEASVEARYRLTEELVGAAFLDMGFDTPGPLQLTNARSLTQDMLYAAGIGVRYRTPVGPIRVDLVRRLEIGQPRLVFDVAGNPAPAPATSPSCFGLFPSRSASYAGAPPDDLCTFHLTVGEAF